MRHSGPAANKEPMRRNVRVEAGILGEEYGRETPTEPSKRALRHGFV